MASRTAQGLLSLEARRLCVWSPCATSFSPGCADRRTGEVQFDFGLSGVSPKLGDSDRPQQTQRTEELVVFTVRIPLSDVGRSDLRSDPLSQLRIQCVRKVLAHCPCSKTCPNASFRHTVRSFFFFFTSRLTSKCYLTINMLQVFSSLFGFI